MIRDRDAQLILATLLFIAGSVAKDVSLESMFYISSGITAASVAIQELSNGLLWLAGWIDRLTESMKTRQRHREAASLARSRRDEVDGE